LPARSVFLANAKCLLSPPGLAAGTNGVAPTVRGDCDCGSSKESQYCGSGFGHGGETEVVDRQAIVLATYFRNAPAQHERLARRPIQSVDGVRNHCLVGKEV